MTQKSSPIVKQSPQLPESHVMALALNADTMQIAHAANKAANLFFFIAIIVFVRPPNPNKQKKDVGVCFSILFKFWCLLQAKFKT